jgi:hypothetical protein
VGGTKKEEKVSRMTTSQQGERERGKRKRKQNTNLSDGLS